MNGQTQLKYGKVYEYYRHVRSKYQKKCGTPGVSSIPLPKIENAVFKDIFRNVVDVPAFEAAIKESLPDEKIIKSLEDKIKAGDKELKRIDRELGKLVDAVLKGTLRSETIKSKESALLETKAKLSKDIEEAKIKLRSMPDFEQVKKEAEIIRRQLLEHYGSGEHIQEMSFDDKKTAAALAI